MRTYEQKRAAAIQSILDDYLLLGMTYPPKGSNAVCAGQIVMWAASDDQIENAMTAMVYSCGEQILTARERIEKICTENTEDYFGHFFPHLVLQRMDELEEEERERIEVS